MNYNVSQDIKSGHTIRFDRHRGTFTVVAADRAQMSEAAGASMPTIRFELRSATDAALQPQWADLTVRAVTDNPFHRPQWLIPAASAFGMEAPRVLCAWQGDGPAASLVFMAPVIIKTLLPGVKQLRIVSWNSDYAPLAAPLMADQLNEETVKALVAFCRRDLGISSIIFQDQRLDDDFTADLMAHCEALGLACETAFIRERAVLHGPQDADAFLNGVIRTKKRKELRRLKRRLAERGPVEVRVCTDPGQADTCLDAFMTIERAGWKGRRGTALESNPVTQTLARSTIGQMMSAGMARIMILQVGDQAIAGLIILTAGSEAVTWKIAYDEDFAKFSPGVLLMIEATRYLLGDPTISRTDSSAIPDHPMINHLWPDRMAVADLVISTRPIDRYLSRASYRMSEIVQRAKSAIRRRLNGIVRR